MHYSHKLAYVYGYRGIYSRICEVIPHGNIVNGDDKGVCSCMDVVREIQRGEVIDSLVHSLQNDGDWHGRGEAAIALGRIGDVSAVPALTHALEHDERWSVRCNAAYALGEIGDTSAVPALTHALQHDGDKDVRSAAADALGEYRRRRSKR